MPILRVWEGTSQRLRIRNQWAKKKTIGSMIFWQQMKTMYQGESEWCGWSSKGQKISSVDKDTPCTVLDSERETLEKVNGDLVFRLKYG